MATVSELNAHSLPPSPEASAASGHGRSHAKLILFGEHSVVHGHPAIAVPVHSIGAEADAVRGDGPLDVVSDDPQITARDGWQDVPLMAAEATLRRLGLPASGVHVSVRSRVPAGRGFGSSAAVAGAIVNAVADLHGAELDQQARFELVQEAERVAHGNPSGLDARTTVAERGIAFQGGVVREFDVVLGGTLIVADTGVHGSTRRAVADVRALLEREPERTGALLDRLGAIARDAERALRVGDARATGGMMDKSQRILRELGVSSTEIEALVTAAKGAGALGAKLSGGGQGGCIVALIGDGDDATVVTEALRAAGATGIWSVPPAPHPSGTTR